MIEAEITVATRTRWGAARAVRRLARAVRGAGVVIESHGYRAIVTYPPGAQARLLAAAERLGVATRIVIGEEWREAPGGAPGSRRDGPPTGSR